LTGQEEFVYISILMLDLYILDGNGEPVIETSRTKWAMSYGRSISEAGNGVISQQIGDSKVSTIFLGIDHNLFGKGPPILWETMVFGGPMQGTQDRCTGSREQALSMHCKMVARVKAATTQVENITLRRLT
jgi:hypothetical protein